MTHDEIEGAVTKLMRGMAMVDERMKADLEIREEIITWIGGLLSRIQELERHVEALKAEAASEQRPS
jgi:hypothetical protein